MKPTGVQAWRRWGRVIVAACLALGLGAATGQAASDINGDVVAVDGSAGRLTISTGQSSKPVTFFVNKATKINAGDSKDLGGVTKGDSVRIEYEGNANHYVAKTVTVLPK